MVALPPGQHRPAPTPYAGCLRPPGAPRAGFRGHSRTRLRAADRLCPMSALPAASVAAGLHAQPPAPPPGLGTPLRARVPALGAPAPSSDLAPSFDVGGLHVYLLGVGGCGMSGLARLLRARGALVGGSDLYASPFTDALQRDGIEVGFDQARSWLPERCDLVVASAAIKPEHPQRLEAARRAVPVLSYAQALGRCMAGTTGIAIAGTHGKSTTTAMLGVALAEAGLDPSVIVGATCPQLGADQGAAAG